MKLVLNSGRELDVYRVIKGGLMDYLHIYINTPKKPRLLQYVKRKTVRQLLMFTDHIRNFIVSRNRSCRVRKERGWSGSSIQWR